MKTVQTIMLMLTIATCAFGRLPQPLEIEVLYPDHSAATYGFYHDAVQPVNNPPRAMVHYVDLNSPAPTPPYSSWQSAATNIQDAVDAAVEGDTVLVADGHYFPTSEISVTNTIAVRSHNGPDVTIIDGGGSNRCFNLYSNLCAVSGFTITNGYYDELSYYGGGGIFCNFSKLPVISDCIIVGNRGSKGGGIAGGTVIGCTIVSNTALGGGGVVGSRLENCLISGNSAEHIAGGIFIGAARNCVVSNNVAGSAGGGIYRGAATNCLIAGNTAGNDGGGAFYSTLFNCTVSDNLATNNGGGMCAGTGFSDGLAFNCIVYHNTALNSGDDWSGEGVLLDSCSSADWALLWAGCITNAPMFIDRSNGNYRLAPISPCIDAGNNLFVSHGADLDEYPRIVDGSVDMGAYEYGFQGSFITNFIASGNQAILEWPVFPMWESAVRWSTNLTTGFQPVETGIEYPRNSCTDTVHAAENQCFYQVEVQLK